jgi:CRISPR-associated protein Cmr3
MRWFSIEPLDSLFFREGRPFNQGEGGGLRVEGLFPPTATTVVGALRAALAQGDDATKARGGAWVDGPWDQPLKAELGNFADLKYTRTKSLNFRGPYLVRNHKLYFPAPAHLQGFFEGEDLRRVVYLLPGESYQTDRGKLRLPTPEEKPEPGHEPKELDAYWISQEGMQKVLEGWNVCPEDLVHRAEFWKSENRVGIQLTGKNTDENALYEVQHIRLQRKVGLWMGLEGTGWNPKNPATLGGESRMVWLTEETTQPTLPKLEKNPSGKCVAILLTPVAVAELDHSIFTSGNVTGLGKVVSASLPKPIWIGGFDGIKREPQPLKPYLPAGSVFFLDSLDPNFNGFIGTKMAWGYGQLVVGKWRNA